MLYYPRAEKMAYQGLVAELSVINQALTNTDWSKLANGSYQLSETVTMNVFNYQTQERSAASWEAHRQHIDVQCIISGAEWVDLTTDTLETTSYDEINDGAALTGNETYGVPLTSADCLILLPNEAHRTGIHYLGEQNIRKAVFKIKREG